jgi:3-isopropylmalate/(R)-2-methylmalate dehydratase small subunit
MAVSNRAWVFGDNVDTDNIFPTRFGGDATLKEIGSHAFYDFRPDFAPNAKPGDVVVAGYNFACGSYREGAALTIRALGIRTLVGRSFARAFYRNAVNNGLWLVTIGDQEFDCQDGSLLDVNVESGLVTNRTTTKQVTGTPLSGIAVKIVEAGGATKYFKPMVLHPVCNKAKGVAQNG